MTGNTIPYRRGATFEYAGVLQEPDGTPIELNSNEIGFNRYEGQGMEHLAVEITNGSSGTFKVSLPSDGTEKLPEGRQSWFELKVTYSDGKVTVFPPIWVDTI